MTPKSSPPSSASRSDCAPFATRREDHERRPPRPTTPAKNASPDDHQIAAGASTTNGIAIRARCFVRRSRAARSARPHRPRHHRRAQGPCSSRRPPARRVRSPTAGAPSRADDRERASCTSGSVARTATRNTWGSWIVCAVCRVRRRVEGREQRRLPSMRDERDRPQTGQRTSAQHEQARPRHTSRDPAARRSRPPRQRRRERARRPRLASRTDPTAAPRRWRAAPRDREDVDPRRRQPRSAPANSRTTRA